MGIIRVGLSAADSGRLPAPVLLLHRAGKTGCSVLADISAVELQDRCPDTFI